MEGRTPKEREMMKDRKIMSKIISKEWYKTQNNMACGTCGQIHEGKCDFKFLKENNLTWLSDEQIKELETD